MPKNYLDAGRKPMQNHETYPIVSPGVTRKGYYRTSLILLCSGALL